MNSEIPAEWAEYSAEIDIEAEFFAFAYGVRLALEAHGFKTGDLDGMIPVLQKMLAVTDNPKQSLLKYHDDVEFDVVTELKKTELSLCLKYLRTVEENGT